MAWHTAPPLNMPSTSTSPNGQSGGHHLPAVFLHSRAWLGRWGLMGAVCALHILLLWLLSSVGTFRLPLRTIRSTALPTITVSLQEQVADSARTVVATHQQAPAGTRHHWSPKARAAFRKNGAPICTLQRAHTDEHVQPFINTQQPQRPRYASHQPKPRAGSEPGHHNLAQCHT